MSRIIFRPQSNQIKRYTYSWLARLKLINIVSLSFLIVIAITGGSSRSDDIMLLILRPVTVICLFILLISKPIKWKSIRILLLMLTALGLVHVMQLLPLPPTIWKILPIGTIYGGVLGALEQGTSWHPLSIAPDATWNSLVALLVPFTVMSFYVSYSPKIRIRMLWTILLLASASMALGILQYVNGEDSGLYWHSVSGRGQMIGFFANRNHQGALLGMSLPILRAWMAQPVSAIRARNIRLYVGLGAIAVIIVYAFVLGSRAGLLLTIVGLLAAFFVDPSLGVKGPSKSRRSLMLVLICVVISILVAVVLNADRAISLGRISAMSELSDEGRLRALPTLLRILRETWVWGVGFGGFVPVYATFEPAQLLKPTYFNHAHNDLIELVITGGFPALLITGVFFLWLTRATFQAFWKGDSRNFDTTIGRAAAFAIIIALIASLTDYPLRTPLMTAIFTTLCCCLALCTQEVKTILPKEAARN